MKFERVVHFSGSSRLRGHPGGVEKFAWYLSQAIGCEILTPQDEPDLNDPRCLYITDAHWRLSIPVESTALVVMHGCAAERGHNRRIGKLQKKLKGIPNTYYVCNSLQTQHLCKQYYDLDIPEIIYLAVDEDLYFPPLESSGNVVLTTTANKTHKGVKTINKLRKAAPELEVRDLNCGLDEEADAFRQANVFILLSRHEGFAFSVLEAMAANLPVVVTPNGIAYELQHQNIPGVFIIQESEMKDVRRVHQLVERALTEPSETRAWVKEKCSLQLFNTHWQEIIDRFNKRF